MNWRTFLDEVGRRYGLRLLEVEGSPSKKDRYNWPPVRAFFAVPNSTLGLRIIVDKMEGGGLEWWRMSLYLEDRARGPLHPSLSRRKVEEFSLGGLYRLALAAIGEMLGRKKGTLEEWME